MFHNFCIEKGGGGIRPRVLGGESHSLCRDASSHRQSAPGGQCTPPRGPLLRWSLPGSDSPYPRMPVLSRFRGTSRGGRGSNGSRGGSVPAPLSPFHRRAALPPLRRSPRKSQQQHAAELDPFFLQATEALCDRGDRSKEPLRGYGGPKEIISILPGQRGESQSHVT